MNGIREKVISEAIDILKLNPNGVRRSHLANEIKNRNPHISIATIRAFITMDLCQKRPKEIYKPDRGLYLHTKFRNISEPSTKDKKINEEDFYQPFADWLVNELEECTKAISLGGAVFKDRWGTPDVIGIRKPRMTDIIKPLTEIVSAEIKIDTGNLITAFGQACSYKLFSHKSYIVIPKNSFEEDIARLDSLCIIFGIGLILFDSSNIKLPEFEIRVRASKQEPDKELRV
jgi:hypothetical protein